MNRFVRQLLAGLLLALATLPAMFAQEAGDTGPRRILARATPAYPDLARSLHLEGTVRLQVTVGANGTVKSVQAIGGNPVLVKAAEDSIYGFKWAPASHESKELVEIKFQAK